MLGECTNRGNTNNDSVISYPASFDYEVCTG